MNAVEYIAAIRKIIEADNLSATEKQRRVDELKCQRLLTMKEFAYENGVNYRTVRRWARAGKVTLVPTLSGKRIMSSTALSAKATTT